VRYASWIAVGVVVSVIAAATGVPHQPAAIAAGTPPTLPAALRQARVGLRLTTTGPTVQYQTGVVRAVLTRPIGDGTITFSLLAAGNVPLPLYRCTPRRGACAMLWSTRVRGRITLTAHWSGDRRYRPAQTTLTLAVRPARYVASGLLGRQSVGPLTQVRPTPRVDHLGDAVRTSLLLRSFRTGDPRYRCLRGATLAVYTAARTFPGEVVIYTRGRGSRCPAGAWLTPIRPTIAGGRTTSGAVGDVITLRGSFPGAEPESVTAPFRGAAGSIAEDGFVLSWSRSAVRIGVPVELSRASYIVGLRWHDRLTGATVDSRGTPRFRVTRTTIPVVVAKTTRVLNATTLRSLQIPPGTSTIDTSRPVLVLAFAQTTLQARGLAPGDVIVAGITPATPDGLLRRVVAVRHIGGVVSVTTWPASVTDVFSQGTIRLDNTLTTHNIDPRAGGTVSIAGGLTSASAPALTQRMHIPAFLAHPPMRGSRKALLSAQSEDCVLDVTPRVELNRTLRDAFKDAKTFTFLGREWKYQGSVNGAGSVAVHFCLRARIRSLFALTEWDKHVGFRADVTGTATPEISFAGSASIRIWTDIKFNPQVIEVDGVPIVYRFVIRAQGGVTGEGEVTFRSTFSLAAGAHARLECDDIAHSLLSQCSTQGTGIDLPQIERPPATGEQGGLLTTAGGPDAAVYVPWIFVMVRFYGGLTPYPRLELQGFLPKVALTGLGERDRRFWRSAYIDTSFGFRAKIGIAFNAEVDASDLDPLWEALRKAAGPFASIIDAIKADFDQQLENLSQKRDTYEFSLTIFDTKDIVLYRLPRACVTACLRIATVAGSGDPDGPTDDNTPVDSIGLDEPTGVAVADRRSGLPVTFFIADSAHNTIRRVEGKAARTVAGDGLAGYGDDNIAATRSSLNTPTGIVVGPDGNLFVVDTGNNVVRRVESSTGIITTMAGTGVPGYAGDRGEAIIAQLNRPEGAALGKDGVLYIADTGNDRVRAVDAHGRITTVVGSGAVPTDGLSIRRQDSILATHATLNAPTDVAVDMHRNILYIADAGDNVIRAVTLSNGRIKVYAGTGDAGYGGDGKTAVDARLNSPVGIAVDRDGNLYIADAGNNRVRMVTPDGVIGTIAGGETAGFDGDGNPAVLASLHTPVDVAADDPGHVYVVDRDNRRIRLLSIDNGLVHGVTH